MRTKARFWECFNTAGLVRIGADYEYTLLVHYGGFFFRRLVFLLAMGFKHLPVVPWVRPSGFPADCLVAVCLPALCWTLNLLLFAKVTILSLSPARHLLSSTTHCHHVGPNRLSCFARGQPPTGPRQNPAKRLVFVDQRHPTRSFRWRPWPPSSTEARKVA